MNQLKTYLLLLMATPALAQMPTGIKESLKQKYTYVSGLENGLAIVRDAKNKTGIVDSLGNELVPPIYNYININRRDSLRIEAGYTIKGIMKRGFINRNGKVIIPIQYDDVSSFNNGYSVVGLGNKYGVIDSLNTLVIPIKYSHITGANENRFIVTQNNLEAIFDARGQKITEFSYANIERFYNGYAMVELPNKSTSIMNPDGKLAFPPITNHTITSYKNGYSTIRNRKTNKIGLVNNKGQFTIPCTYDELELANEKVIGKQKNKYGVLSYNNAIVTPFDYDLFVAYPNNRFLVATKQQYGLLDNNNKTILPVQYKNVQSDLTYTYFYVTNANDLDGIYDYDAQPVVPEAYRFYTIDGTVIFCTKEGKAQLLHYTDLSKNIYLPDNITFKKQELGYGMRPSKNQIFSDGTQWGVLNSNNEVLIQPAYDDLQPLYNATTFIAKSNGKYGIISQHNKVLRELKYDQVEVQKETIHLKIKNQKEELYSIGYEEN